MLATTCGGRGPLRRPHTGNTLLEATPQAEVAPLLAGVAIRLPGQTGAIRGVAIRRGILLPTVVG